MKALALNQPGTPDRLTLTELPVPSPRPGEIRVRVRAVSLNPVDYKVMRSGHPDLTCPFVPGVDVAGIVDEVGEGVSRWKAGDRVVYHADFTRMGGYAEYAVTTAHTAAAIPDGISYLEAAAFPCAGLTAYQALVRKMRIGAGQSVFIHAGAGGVGGFAIQLAKAFGADLIITSASPGNFDYVRSLGAHEVIDYNTENVHERIRELTGGLGADLILSSVDRATAQADLSALAFGGQLACVAGMPENVADVQPPSLAFTIHKINLGGAHKSGNRKAQEDLARMAEQFMQLMLDKKIDPMIASVIRLEEVPQALNRLMERHVRGKIVAELA